MSLIRGDRTLKGAWLVATFMPFWRKQWNKEQAPATREHKNLFTAEEAQYNLKPSRVCVCDIKTHSQQAKPIREH